MEDFDGGFMQSSPKRDSTVKRSTRHFTIRQLNSADLTNAAPTIDDSPTSFIIIIGWIDTVKKASSGYAFTIQDFSGIINCSFWPKTDYETTMSGCITENLIVKLYATLRTFNNKANLNVISILRVEDMNEIIYHNLQAIYESLYMQNKLKRKVIKNSVGANGNIKEDILDVYRKNQDMNGLHVDVVVRMLANRYSESEVRENVEILLNDCHLYSVDGMEYHTTV